MSTDEKSGDLFNRGSFADSIAKGASIVGKNIAKADNNAASGIRELADGATKVFAERISWQCPNSYALRISRTYSM